MKTIVKRDIVKLNDCDGYLSPDVLLAMRKDQTSSTSYGVEKAGKTGPIAAGLVVRAEDTGRVLMLQRAIDDEDPAAGRWEFPGGKLEDGEEPLAAARREWAEETGLEVPVGKPGGTWVSSDGVYHGYVVEVPSEIGLDIFARDLDANPDDPDGDHVEAIAWWNPTDLRGNPAVRDEVRADAGAIISALGVAKAARLEKAGNPRALINWYNSGADGAIQWGSPGDFDSCVRLAGKHVRNPQGFCAERHHDAVGKWPGEGRGKKMFTIDPSAGILVTDQEPGSEGSMTTEAALKYSTDQPRDAHGRFAPGGKKKKGGGGREIGSVFVGSKDSVGETISHPTHGTGTITAVDAKKEVVTVQHGDGESRVYAAAFAPQKAKFIATGSEQGKTHIANVKAMKNGDVVNRDDGKTVGKVHQAANGTWGYTHSDTSVTNGGYASKHKAIQGLIEHNNAEAAKKPPKPPVTHEIPHPTAPVHPAEAPTEAPVAEKKPYETIGKVSLADLNFNQGVVTHTPTGAVIGSYTHGDLNTVTHADGKTISVPVGISRKEALAIYHNGTYGGKPAAEEPKPEPEVKPEPTPAPVVKKPAWTKAGSDLKPTDVVAKKTGELVHKGTGTVIGTIGKNHTGWTVTHADGTKESYNPTKKAAIQQVLNHHNAATAVHEAVVPNHSTEWSEIGYVGIYSVKKTVENDVVHNITGQKIGHISFDYSTSTATVEHVSGASYQHAGNYYGGQIALVQMHNSAASLAEGHKVAPKPTPRPEPATVESSPVGPSTPTATEGGKQPYEKIGSVGSGQLSGTNLQKENGKIVGSTMVFSDVVVGHTKALPDGTVEVTHADGHVIGAFKPGTGQVTQQLSTYHNGKYGDQTLPKPTIESIPKIEPTEISSSPGGLHNDPISSYSPAPKEVQQANYHTSESLSRSGKAYGSVPDSGELGMNAAQKAAIKYYTGSGYTPMNNYLRTGKVSPYNATTVIKHINNLDSAFQKTPELKDKIVTYRGLGYGSTVFGPVGSKVGKTAVDEGYGSTAAYVSKAFGGDTVVRITVPAGTRVLKPSSLGSYYDGESEILLPRGAVYHVMRDEIVNGKRQIDAVVVGNAIQ